MTRLRLWNRLTIQMLRDRCLQFRHARLNYWEPRARLLCRKRRTDDGVCDRAGQLSSGVDRAVCPAGDSLDAFGVHARPRRVKPQAVFHAIRVIRGKGQ